VRDGVCRVVVYIEHEDPIRRYSVGHVRRHLAELLEEIEGGRTIEITRRGLPVAVVVSVLRSIGVLVRTPTPFEGGFAPGSPFGPMPIVRCRTNSSIRYATPEPGETWTW
jgi:prevent-host-death family protein